MVAFHDCALNAPLLTHTMLMTAIAGLTGSIAPDRCISSLALVVPERSNRMRWVWVRESYCPISARSQMLWASLRDAISGRR